MALLLHAGGDNLHDIFDPFALNDNQKKELDGVLKKFNDHFVPARNVTYERFHSSIERNKRTNHTNSIWRY